MLKNQQKKCRIKKNKKLLKKVLTVVVRCGIIILVRERARQKIKRSIAQPGSAPALGAGGRRFKSCCSDHLKLYITYAGIAQLVERQPSKLNVASSTLVSRSICVTSSVGRALDF